MFIQTKPTVDFGLQIRNIVRFSSSPMPDKDQKIKSETDDSSLDTEKNDDLTAEKPGERAYDEGEIWKKNKNSLFTLLGSIALVVAGISFFKNRGLEEDAERSRRYITASTETEGAEERFLSFANDYEDKLGGVARYRAAILQYKDNRFDEAAENFKAAAQQLSGDPLYGRSLLGQAIARIKSNTSTAEGKSILTSLAMDPLALEADRREAQFLLAVNALGEDDEKLFNSQRDALLKDVNASDFSSRLEKLSKTKKMLEFAVSLPDYNSDKGAVFLAANKEKDETKTLASGLQYQILQNGKGEDSPSLLDEVEVHYHGTLINGDVFDSSVDREETAKFKVNAVIKGWTEALQLMKTGDKWKLFIPSDLAYGKNGNNSIGPNETLIFEVELLNIFKNEQVKSDSKSFNPDSPASVAENDANSTSPPMEIEANASKSSSGIQE